MQRDAQVARTKREVAEVESLRSREQLFVEQERNRIARDMHDVVAHSLAVVVAQADGGRYAMRTNPASGEETLTKIAEISRDALVEVRGLLGQLRHSQPSGPQPGFADAPVVLERMRLAGLRILVESSGAPQSLRQNADIALYRLVQESLTNSLRHGDPNLPTIIRIAWGPELRVEVENTCNPVPPPPRADSGHGLIGMRERIVMSGGTLEAGRIGDRFHIVAVVPTVPQGDTAPTRTVDIVGSRDPVIAGGNPAGIPAAGSPAGAAAATATGVRGAPGVVPGGTAATEGGPGAQNDEPCPDTTGPVPGPTEPCPDGGPIGPDERERLDRWTGPSVRGSTDVPRRGDDSAAPTSGPTVR
nr:histidine kinase [Pseudoclavibacter chungangensis]